MKKWSIILLLIINQSAVAIGDYQTPKAMHYLTGFYLKAGLGGTIAQLDATQDFSYFANFSDADSVRQPVTHQIQGTQMAALLGFGYDYQIDALWILGAEFTMGFTGANASFDNDTNFAGDFILKSNSQATLWNDFALVVKPGLVIQQKTQFYTLLGTRWGNFETSSSSTATAFGETISDSTTVWEYVLGFTVGLGVERMLTKHWSCGLEYAYTSYGDIPNADGFSASAAANTLLLETAYRF